MEDILLGKVLEGGHLIALALAVIAIFFLLTGLRRRQRERWSREETTGPREPETSATLDSKQRLRRDLESLLGELNDLARKISAEIDTRFAKLEAAMRDADRRIATLHRLTRDLGEKTGNAPTQADDIDTRHAAVYEMADAGVSPIDIARDLGKTPGEIELILNLRRTARQAGPATS